ncbi:MAG: hypothetical protein Q4G03_00575 [Planctomycetia bacterium]|nr:hypothetical protein [Planctomycetia bacterium]
MNDLYNKLWRLQHKLGMKGYGAYCRLVDLCEAFKKRGVPYDLEELARTVNERAGIVHAVVHDFALFRIVDGKIEEIDSTALTDDEALERRVEILERNLKAIELLTRYGVRGYGVFCRLSETCRAQGNRGVKYDLEELADLLNEKAQLVKQIVEERGLFELVGDEVRLCQDESPLTHEIARKRQIRQNRRVGAQKGYAARRARQRQEEEIEQPVKSEQSVSQDLECVPEIQPPRARGQGATRKSKSRTVKQSAPSEETLEEQNMSLEIEPDADIQDDANDRLDEPLNPNVQDHVDRDKQTCESQNSASMQTTVEDASQQVGASETITQDNDFDEFDGSDVYAAALAKQTEQTAKSVDRSTKRSTSGGKKQTRDKPFDECLQQVVESFEDFKNDPVYREVMQRHAKELTKEEEEQIRQIHERLARVRDIWNEIFAKTRRTVHDHFHNALIMERFTASSKLYTDEDYREAFEEAKRSSFPWQFKDVIKPDNIQRLLTSAEIEKTKAAQKNNTQQSKSNGSDNKPLDSETLEVIQYGRNMGWN